MILGIAKEGVDKGFCVEILVAFFRSVDICLASESADRHDVGFVTAPGLLGGFVMVEEPCRDDAVQVRCVLYGIKPEGVWEASIEKEGACGLDKHVVQVLSDTIMLRCMYPQSLFCA